ncbi:hypothetical protein F2P56_030022 [Juglans regia]|uniref:Uncharacterized protein n=1 Tax=Juglans regia TaxID=51240 RepID=A0A833U0C6_JUGRE|nr:hypothetical protein F2P56_030022 [Juglans regia]
MKYMVDPESNEVSTKIRLVPVKANESDFEDNGTEGINGFEAQEVSFMKTPTQSDGESNKKGTISQLFTRPETSRQRHQSELAVNVEGGSKETENIRLMLQNFTILQYEISVGFTEEELLLHDLHVLVAFAEQKSTSERLKQGITQVLSILDGQH